MFSFEGRNDARVDIQEMREGVALALHNIPERDQL